MKSTKKVNWNRISKSFKQYLKEAEEKFPDEVTGNDGIIFKKISQNGNGAKYNQYYRGYDIDFGGHLFGSVAELERFMKNYILSNTLYNKYKHKPEKPISKSLEEAEEVATEVPPATDEVPPATEVDPNAAAGAAGEVDPNAAAAATTPATTPAPPPVPAGIPIKFNIDKVKRYNTGKFLSDAGVIKSIDKKGIVVTTQPDGVDVLVNFDDISESVKRFFKTKK